MATMEPTEFEESVKVFNTAFNSRPKTREQMHLHLIDLLEHPEDSPEDDPAEGRFGRLLDYVMALQRMAVFGLRLGLIVEEVGEWTEAVLKERPVAEQSKEMADVEYVVHGANDALGYDAGASRYQVAIKNHKKVLGAKQMRIGDSGKIIKPEDQ